jgi:hypothetical protein
VRTIFTFRGNAFMLMSPDLFLDCILYIINDNSNEARRLVRELIGLYETDARNNARIDHDVTRFYTRILKAIMDTGVSKQNRDELRVILLKFQSEAMLSKRGEIYQLLHDTFMSTEELTAERLEQYAERIRNVLKMQLGDKAARTFYGTLARARDMVNPLDQAAELRKLPGIAKEVETVFSGGGPASSLQRSLVERIDLSDKISMQAGLTKNRARAISGVLKLGLQGLNRMLGKKGGLARGETLMVYALPHNYKSGLLMSVAGWVVLYNTPAISGEEAAKKPLVLLISVENEAYQNFVWMFRHFYQTINQMTADHLTDDEVSDWTYNTFSAKGYTLIIERHLPTDFGYQQFVERVEYYENSGYVVVAASVDYPNLMKMMEAARHDLAVRALISALCNYTKTKGITFIAAHPLGRKAKELAASGITNVVKRLDTSHLSDSFDVAKEVDVEVFVHIERNLDGTAYLTFQRGKHRYVDDTPLAHQYFAYRFHPTFGIRDDLLLAPEYVSDIYSDPLSLLGARGVLNQPTEAEQELVSVF